MSSKSLTDSESSEDEQEESEVEMQLLERITNMNVNRQSIYIKKLLHKDSTIRKTTISSKKLEDDEKNMVKDKLKNMRFLMKQ